MKTSSKKIVCLHLQALCALSVLCALLTMTNSARAAGGSATWLAAPTDGNWLSPTPDINWSTGVGAYPSATSGTSSGDIASFTNSSSITTINCASAFVVGGFTFDMASASAYTINTGPGTWRVSLTGSANGAVIKTTSTVVNRQTITGQLRMASSGSNHSDQRFRYSLGDVKHYHRHQCQQLRQRWNPTGVCMEVSH